MERKTYDQFAIGDSSSLTRVVADDDVKRFVELSGDDNPLHTDSDFASQTEFKRPVVHGMLTGNFVSTLIGKQIPGPGALWVSQEFKFLAPVRVGDRLTVSGVVVKKYDREQMLEIEVRATVDGRGDVLRGRGLVKLIRPQASELPKDKLIRRALVTGASGSIGGQIAFDLATSGIEVVVQYLNGRDRAEQLTKKIVEAGGQCRPFRCDLQQTEDIGDFMEEFLSRFGPTDILVVNASEHVNDAGVLATSRREIDRTLNLQLHSTMAMVRALAPTMTSQGWGRILAVSSDAVHSQPTRGWLSYNIGKVALETFVRQCAIELGPHGITANSVAPGMTDTDFIGDFPSRARKIVAQMTPNRRLGRPSDVAAVVKFLCTDSADHINGQVIRVNGGIGVA